MKVPQLDARSNPPNADGFRASLSGAGVQDATVLDEGWWQSVIWVVLYSVGEVWNAVTTILHHVIITALHMLIVLLHTASIMWSQLSIALYNNFYNARSNHSKALVYPSTAVCWVFWNTQVMLHWWQMHRAIRIKPVLEVSYPTEWSSCKVYQYSFRTTFFAGWLAFYLSSL